MTTLKPKITTRKNPGGSISFCVDAGTTGNGKRHRKFFTNGRQARAYARKLQEAREKQGDLAFSLTPRQQFDAAKAFERLSPYGAVSLDAVVDYYIKHAQPSGGKKLVCDAVNEFIEIKRRAGKKPRYIRELSCKFANFKATFGQRFLNEISAQEIESWLGGKAFAPITQGNYLRDLGILFSWASKSRNYCAENIVSRIETPKTPESETEVFEVCDAQTLLFAAHIRQDLELVPYLACGLFAGLRSSELEKLDWENINLHQRLIEVTAASAKSSRHRLVTISENLYAWLQPHEKMEGPILPTNLYRRLKELLRMAEIEKWPKNGLRHSFGSYHYAYHANANLTASLLGHRTTSMLYKHYRKLISPDEAKQYWNIFPPKGWMMLHPSEHIQRRSPVNSQAVEEKREWLKQMLSELEPAARNVAEQSAAA